MALAILAGIEPQPLGQLVTFEAIGHRFGGFRFDGAPEPESGFGFITPDDGGEDLFVHQTEIKSEGFRTLQEGEKVGYEPIEDKGKMKAVNVTSTDGGAVKGGSGGGGGRGRGSALSRRPNRTESPSQRRAELHPGPPARCR